MSVQSVVVSIAISIASYYGGFLSADGAVAAVAVGSLVFDTGAVATAQLLTFFLVGSVLTKYRQSYKDGLMPFKPPANKEKHVSGRSAAQVLATGGLPALICCIGTLAKAAPTIRDAFLVRHLDCAYTAVMCTNLADTLASEIGMLSAQSPRLITHWRRRVPTGTDGGVTALGTVTAAISGALIGAIVSPIHISGVAVGAIDGAVFGTIGSALDSLFGGAVQSDIESFAQWQYTNAAVNAASAIATAVLALAVAYIDEFAPAFSIRALCQLATAVIIVRATDMADKNILRAQITVTALWAAAHHTQYIQIGTAILYCAYSLVDTSR